MYKMDNVFDVHHLHGPDRHGIPGIHVAQRGVEKLKNPNPKKASGPD